MRPNDPASAITVRGLRKTYVVPERESGVGAALKSLFHRTTREVTAVKAIDFTIAPGEIVGFLGPNGAGKTTTLKMLAGLLHPTAGEATVLGFTPWERDRAFLRQMALIMGQRNQLAWDIPVLDSFQLNKAIYQVADDDFRTRLDELVAMLELGELVKKPVRNLSLGERMKCEIAGSLLHQPQVLYLDEPTIGLDVAMQRKIRAFIADYNARTGASIMLTSHYMADVEALCQRVIVIHHGTLLYDGDLPGLIDRFSPLKTVVVELEEGHAVPADLLGQLERAGGEIVSHNEHGLTVRAAKAIAPQVTGLILGAVPIADLTVEDPSIEEVIEHVFASSGTGEAAGSGDPGPEPLTPLADENAPLPDAEAISMLAGTAAVRDGEGR
ncbi:MAG: ABC transporter ATP-binding protein [Thermomicrobiales bacterium]